MSLPPSAPGAPTDVGGWCSAASPGCPYPASPPSAPSHSGTGISNKHTANHHCSQEETLQTITIILLTLYHSIKADS